MSNLNQDPSKESSHYRDEIEKTVSAWKSFLSETDLRALMDTAKDPEATDDGVIYEVETPSELSGDFAVVDMKGVKVDTPHLHQDHDNGDEETEVHFAMEGSAMMSVGDGLIELQSGDVYVVSPRTAHFIIPNGNFVDGVLSLPGYDPDKQISIDLQNPPDEFNADLYFEVLGQ